MQQKRCAGCTHRRVCTRAVLEARRLAPGCPHQPRCCPTPPTWPFTNTQVFLRFPTISPSPLMHLSLAPNRDSKLTSSMLSSLSCCVTMNTAGCGPASLQICPLPTPSRGSSLGWGYKKICPNNLAIFCNFQRFGCYAHGLKGIAHLRRAPLGSGRALWSQAESASAQSATLLCGLEQVTQSL